MRGDLRRLAPLALLALAPVAADAQGLNGYAQTQVQVVDQVTVLPDGSVTRKRVERWGQTFEMQHFMVPREDLRVMSSFRFTDLAYRGMPDRSRQPQGTLQVSHPWANLFAAYRPTTVTGGIGPQGVGSGPDTARAYTVTSRAQEAVVTGQIAPPSWPRLDVAWTRRHRDRDVLSADEVGVTRSARMAWNNDAINLYGGWGDQAVERAGVRTGTAQRNLNAGAAVHLVPSTTSNLDLNYDLNDSRVGDPARSNGSSRGHNASLNAGWRPARTVNGSASWLWRRGESRGIRPSLTEDHEGSMQVSVDPEGPTRYVLASGARTVRTTTGRHLASSVSGVASLDGRVREGWTGSTSLTHVTNWAPGLRVWSVEALRAGSQMTLFRGFDVAADAQVSTSDDTTLRDVSTTTEANARVRMTPWNALTVGWNARVSRLGDAVLGTAGGSSVASAWDVRWRPLRTVEWTGTTATTRARGGQRATTRTASLRWAPFANLQATADWSRSSDARATGGAQTIQGREIVSLRLLALLTRRLQVDGAFGVADRGNPNENRQATLTMTWAFGR